MLALLLIWPRYCFPFLWISVYCILEPVNVWLGNRSLASWTKSGDWRPVVSLFLGTLLTGFFWEMWNYFHFQNGSTPFLCKRAAHLRDASAWLWGLSAFSLEVFALYHLVVGFFGMKKDDRYVEISPEKG